MLPPFFATFQHDDIVNIQAVNNTDSQKSLYLCTYLVLFS